MGGVPRPRKGDDLVVVEREGAPSPVPAPDGVGAGGEIGTPTDFPGPGPRGKSRRRAPPTTPALPPFSCLRIAGPIPEVPIPPVLLRLSELEPSGLNDWRPRRLTLPLHRSGPDPAPAPTPARPRPLPL